MVKFHFFDMDHTLIDSDCDVTWKEYLIKHHYAPQSDIALANKFYEDYCSGNLNSEEFNSYQLREFIGKTLQEMTPLLEEHFQEFAKPKVYLKGKELIDKLLKNGEKIAILTSTCEDIATPLAKYFGIDLVLGTPLERDKNNRYTGKIADFQYIKDGKVKIIERYCKAHNISISETAYYGDSINDEIVLSSVGYPFATNPDELLRPVAIKNNWTILDF